MLTLSACTSTVDSSNAGIRLEALPQLHRTSVPFQILHDFQGGPSDGRSPFGVIASTSGAIIGLTNEGGHIHPRDCNTTGCGTIYEYQRSTIVVLHRFQPQPQGFHPSGGLLLHDGVYYGATQGGKYGEGMIFALRMDATGAWVVRPIYEFRGAPDGAGVASISSVDGDGTLYGTTQTGGTGTACLFERAGCGTVFALQPPSTPGGSWNEYVLHSFQGSPSDGAVPSPSLVRRGNSLYGTAELGGASTRCPYLTGCGAIYRVTLRGKRARESVVYSFGVNVAKNDGILPGSLVDGGDGNLYGVTDFGGGGGSPSECSVQVHAPYGCGTVYSFPFRYGKKSRDTILYAFTGPPDGEGPDSLLGSAASGFYGLTHYGGSDSCNSIGCGTVFGIAHSGSTWVETTLHTFTGSDGEAPFGPMWLNGSQLYGTATSGGTSPCYCGTLYDLSL